ncbi:hypothetical protein KNP414_01854 [Paenibacillus mucilaginosus KNP414]|uniref:Uncharacterized protein n=1 Tax=Paenibacillus mucilaginosus (strain KNP414) TaxID=1036673 RepID=F8FQR1_PAEMK|nr:hypothetical protein KNP414_01854 [Paenibacillus mucilaginosus KNP414]
MLQVKKRINSTSEIAEKMGIALLKLKYNWKMNAVTVKQNVLSIDQP